MNDLNNDTALRPQTWQEYIGQGSVKTSLKLMIEAAKQRNEVCDHLLFYGQAGLGKTTLAYLVGQEMGANIKTTSGPALEKTGDLAAILTNLEPYEILFIDEVHRLNKTVEELLYPALESRRLHLIIGKGPTAKTISLELPPFTVVAATTKANMISAPLRSRFGAIFKLDFYSEEDIEQIIKRSAKILGVEISAKAAKLLAKISRFTPRTANRLLRRCRDWAQVHNKNKIDEETVKNTMVMLQIDYLGLEEVDRELLKTIIHKFKGGPVGIRSLSAALNEEEGVIEDVYEPFLIKLGLIQRTPNGRVVTLKAYEHLEQLGINANTNARII